MDVQLPSTCRKSVMSAFRVAGSCCKRCSYFQGASVVAISHTRAELCMSYALSALAASGTKGTNKT